MVVGGGTFALSFALSLCPHRQQLLLEKGEYFLLRRPDLIFFTLSLLRGVSRTHCRHSSALLFLARRFPRTLFLASLGIPFRGTREALCEGERHHGVLRECRRRNNVRVLWARPLPYVVRCR